MTVRAVVALLPLAAVIGTAACREATVAPLPPRPPTWSAPISELARAHLNELVTVMSNNSLKRLTIDWSAFRLAVFNVAGGAQSITDTYPAIREALTLLGDGHSSYSATTGAFIFVPTRSCIVSSVSEPTVPSNIGYVRVGAFTAGGPAGNAFAQSIQNTIRNRDRDDLLGWIVDLRGNTGGNPWPMIAGIGPVLGEDTTGFFIGPTGVTNVWGYAAGASWYNTLTIAQVPQPYVLLRPRPRVAVLVDNGVASSGEATFIAFRQRPRTRSFGVPTCGLSTGNVSFTLSNGDFLNLTGSVMADRTRHPYGDVIAPDEIVTDPAAVVQRAIDWLSSESAIVKRH